MSAETEFPPRIFKLLQDVADRSTRDRLGPWQDENGEPRQDDAEAALKWIAEMEQQVRELTRKLAIAHDALDCVHEEKANALDRAAAAEQRWRELQAAIDRACARWDGMDDLLVPSVVKTLRAARSWAATPPQRQEAQQPNGGGNG